MWALRGWRPPKTVVRVGIGVVMAAALSVAVVAETTAASSAGRNHWRRAELTSHRQRVNHFNVGATHSPKLLRELAGGHRRWKTGTLGSADGTMGVPENGTMGVARPDALQGVDVASYQHPGGQRINWARAARAGIQFAAVKVTEGTYYKNPFALTDLAEAKAAGLSVVAYAFAIPNGNGGSGSPTAQANYLIKDLASAGGRLPPIMLDIEYNPYGAECYGLSQPAMRSWIARFSGEVLAKTGEYPIIYGPGPWWQDCTGGTSRFGQFPLWVPDYTTAPRPALPHGWASYAFWQYSSVGTVQKRSLPAMAPGLPARIEPSDRRAPDDGRQSMVRHVPRRPRLQQGDRHPGGALAVRRLREPVVGPSGGADGVADPRNVPG